MATEAAVPEPASPTVSLTETTTSTSTARSSTALLSRSSIADSLRTCGISASRVDKDDLRRRIRIPDRLRTAVSEAMRTGDAVPCAAAAEAAASATEDNEELEGHEAPIVVFINSKSGGRHGPVLKERLQQLIGEEQVFDLSIIKPSDFIRYGLACLEKLASLGDLRAKNTRERLRIMVAGGDGTVGWILGSLQELHMQKRIPVPPIGIIPLGTGNDLSRSFGWGGSFPFAWRSAIKRSLYRASANPTCQLDSWDAVVSMPVGEEVELPYSLRHLEEHIFDKDGDIEGPVAEKISFFGGAFYNYFSIGMDAQVAYSFHHLRDEKPYLAQGPITNKLIYSGYSCGQGWFFTPCMSDPGLRGLKHILRIHIKRLNCSEWEEVHVPKSVRAVVVLNLHKYASGRNPWGNLKANYLEKRGFVEAHVDDGLVEIFGLKQGWHASMVMAELISAKHMAQAAAIRLEIRGGQLKQAYMQMDGEPWKQPLHSEFSTFVEIKRVPFQSLMISGEW